MVLAFMLLMGVIHFYFVPSLLESERASALRYEHEILTALEMGMVQDLLRGDLAAIYATLDGQIENRNGVWVWLELRNADGKRLYPLTPRPRPSGEYLNAIEHVMVWDGAQVAQLSLVADLEEKYMAALTQVRGLEQMVLLVLVLLLGMGLWLQERWVRRPLARLEHAAARISGGDFDVALPAASRDEIGRLTSEFDVMRSNLRSAQQVLIDAKREAEQASQAKSEFLSRMSHELRTPLNAILGFAQLMELDARDPQSREYIGEILRAGDHLLDLIEEVLDLARVEAGKVNLLLVEADAQKLCRACVTLMQPEAKQMGVQLNARLDAIDGARAYVDETRFKQVLINLLSNAIKYNREGGHVTLSCAPYPSGRLRFSVTDTGKGLDQTQQQRLFNPFDRLGAEGGAVSGTGIGLVISKRLIEAMGGEIGFYSRVGEGSTFWVEVDAVDLSHISNDAQSGANVAPTPALAELPMAPKTLLYIEDNRANLHLVQRIIEQHTPYRLLWAADASQGVALAREHMPDLILLDINLPDRDGFAVLDELRALEKAQSVPVVAVSANATLKDVERGQAVGFAAYLTKPIGVKALLKTIANVLSDSERQRNNETMQ
ncbi:hypothetical protein Tel_00765 [Candidatus Tenderia electrophaga]|jgi:signal transduction histidine kinase/ActR/RegA family two-component response regulator|uniref:histidine kinase n=1 Tax=Candidatus Tenderia electrophaga TaxID=1748243 RepID=A0A0S2T9E4_9GAMM|nr:hypothetical protein Tel_00765 [Candidatus Tenderia electrophaga]